MAPEAGLEPATRRLTAGCSTIELHWNSKINPHGSHSRPVGIPSYSFAGPQRRQTRQGNTRLVKRIFPAIFLIRQKFSAERGRPLQWASKVNSDLASPYRMSPECNLLMHVHQKVAQSPRTALRGVTTSCYS